MLYDYGLGYFLKMITLFSAPEPFVDKFRIIQRNAIKSWTFINPKPEIILFGKAEGLNDVAKEFGIRCMTDVSYNEFATPLVHSVFKAGLLDACNDIVCFVNSDVILTDSFITAIQTAKNFIQGNFLIVGRRWSIYLDRPWNFQKGDWQKGLIAYREYNGFIGSAREVDYLIFPKSMKWDIPPFAVGRGAWEGWLIYNARKTVVPVIDASDFIAVYHQEHENFYMSSEIAKQQNIERKRNIRLRECFAHQYNILHSTHILTYQGLKKPDIIRRISASLLMVK